ncbi:Cell wall-associated hydrolase, NlpC family [Paenibacillus sp. UNCCL117]|uniref:C40 family peptidase n=1 Tax=unclassified Paenibacillus TaxID=185978 RepID=UPI0008887AB3|nr:MULTISPECIES: C40 family peptidase [unclassified Paenibacillus]SDC07791.1 Cell wall-associated hydrolase, NlpC family [Paenibacillus sp. cl123]SFW38127.1 Cell wall-associated hydrolase, NlpC family [Paenibacillus sp. UNCCL117]
MKKPFAQFMIATLIVSGASAAAPSAVQPAQAAGAQTAASSAAAVSIGMSGSDVSLLQQDLQTLGYFTYKTATGYFGTITAQAVRAFQSAYGLTATGQSDVATRSAIDRALVKRKLLANANSYIGTPYVWGGVTPAGFDCSGFVYFMFNKYGVAMSRTNSAAMAEMGTPISRSKLQPGDLVFFALNDPGVVSHVGFYIGNGEFISATRSAGIYVQKLDSSYWGPKYTGARRVY